MKPTKILCKTAALLALCAGAMTNAHADAYDDLRNKWATQLAGGNFNPADSDTANQLSLMSSNAQNYWTTMDKSAGRTALWTDQANWAASATISNSYGRLDSMAAAWATPNTSLYHNASLAADIVAALDWLNVNHYNATLTFYDNWFDWQIGTPKILGNTMTRLYTQLSATQIANYIAAIDHFMPDPTKRMNADGSVKELETGANLLDKALAVSVRGIIGKSSSKLAAGRDAISPALPYVTSSDGFYVDGSFIQHTHVPYVGAYGKDLLSDIAALYFLLKDSSWSVTDPNAGVVYNWAMDSFAPLIYDGAMMDNVRGRGVARQFNSDHFIGRSVISALALLSQGLPASQADTLKARIKGWMQRDTSFGSNYFTPVATVTPGILSGLSISDLTLLKSILNDGSITAADEPISTHVFASMDRVVQREADFAFGLSLFSPRVSAFEYGNGENLRPWWTGMGMTTLHNGDQTQYGGNYWPTINAVRLPGTTTDGSGSGLPKSFTHYPNTRSTVGGAELGGRYAAVGMDFSTLGVTTGKLSGKKAWFLFGDRIVAVGSDIIGSNATNVETIAENRKLNGAGDNALTVNGITKSSGAGWSEAMPAVSWAHLAGSGSGADIGYHFPDLPTINGLREARSASWLDINSSGKTAVAGTVSNTFLSLALSHGVNPTAGSYTYVILPGRSAADMAAYAAAPAISVLERSSSASAVRDGSQGLVGAVFWADASKTVSMYGQPYLTSDKRAAVVTQQSGADLKVSVADPTQTNTGNINLEIGRSATAVVSSDPGVTVTQLSPTIKLTINVNLAAGKSFDARFTVNNTLTLAPTDDAFCRSGSYAATNYGGANTLYLKNDTLGYARTALLKFDLAAVPGEIDSASLNLTTSAVGPATGMTHNAYLTASNSWSEASVTWNTLPSLGAPVTSWAVPTAGNVAQLPLTAQAAAAKAGNTPLSLKIEAALNYGPNGWAEYASKENTAVAKRPALVVTYH